MTSLASRAAQIWAAGWPSAIGAIVGGVVGGTISGGTEAGMHGALKAAVAGIVGAVVGAGLGNLLIGLIRWQRPWWVRLIVGVTGTLALAIAIVFGIFQVGFAGSGTREPPKQTEPDRAIRIALARRFAPVLKENRRPRELFLPISRNGYVGFTDLKDRVGTAERIVDAAPTVRTLPRGPCKSRPGCAYFLDVTGAEPDPGEGPGQRAYDALEEHAIDRGAHHVVYYHVTQYDDSKDYAVQYWFLYFFNYRLNEHESDWEQITIRLDSSRRPINALYSAHISGHTRSWDKVEKQGEHPVVYVALGSHANFFDGGRFQVPVSCRSVSGGRKICIYESATCDLADGRGPSIALGRDGYELRELRGPPLFQGSYGSGNYVLGKKKPDVLSDPRTRSVWLDPLIRLEGFGRGEKERRCART